MFYSNFLKKAWILGVVWLVFPVITQAKTALIEFETDKGLSVITAEVAETVQEHEQGLMNRTDLPWNTGMLFVFWPVQETAFWMKNTPLPLDLLFIDNSKQVVNVHKNAEPHSLEPLESLYPIQWVLEVNAGKTKEMTYQGKYIIRSITVTD